jgi:endogenous inhibitor of DNA gyrase (YacG/DUF329 family)
VPSDHPEEHSGKPMVDRIVRCPTCGGDSVYAASNTARPFCSVRCKNMDFGAWASENFRVAASAASEDGESGDTSLH